MATVRICSLVSGFSAIQLGMQNDTRIDHKHMYT
jgi:hypothetical protein